MDRCTTKTVVFLQLHQLLPDEKKQNFPWTMKFYNNIPTAVWLATLVTTTTSTSVDASDVFVIDTFLEDKNDMLDNFHQPTKVDVSKQNTNFCNENELSDATSFDQPESSYVLHDMSCLPLISHGNVLFFNIFRRLCTPTSHHVVGLYLRLIDQSFVVV
jgi:hypothetical protein